MATIDVDIIFGPVSFGHEANPPGFTFGYSLNDLNDAQACDFQFPKNGIVNDFTYTTSGWIWHTLATPATAVVGETAAVNVFPGSTPPDTSNYIVVQDGELFYYNNPNNMQFGSVWSWGVGPNAMAVRYNDGDVVGFACTNAEWPNIFFTSTPDEVGDKFTLPVDMTCKGARIWIYNGGSTMTFEAVLYNASDAV